MAGLGSATAELLPKDLVVSKSTPYEMFWQSDEITVHVYILTARGLASPSSIQATCNSYLEVPAPPFAGRPKRTRGERRNRWPSTTVLGLSSGNPPRLPAPHIDYAQEKSE